MKIAPKAAPRMTEESPNSMSSLPAVAGSKGPQHFAGQEVQGEAESLEKCEGCGRSFNMNALERHMKICKSVFGSKRKPMDSKKQRLKGVVPYGY